MSIPYPPPPEKGGGPCSSSKKIRIGICAMPKKATSKPMRAIMSKIVEYYADEMEYFVFPEQVIMKEPVERWPLCDCLISFHSADFPLYKAIEYVRLRKPYVINDLSRQYDLQDRRKIFRTLASEGIEHPRHGVVIRGDPNEPDGTLIEHNDHIEVNGMTFNKPFVEKPISAEDHNIYIYYPSSVGGGSQRLFRKINNRSSWYSPVSEVRKDGSYLYEDFIPADGTDVKVYAVGPDYAHAEARKAPGLDGKVERDSDGKEVRYPVILSAAEKAIARKVVLAFSQTVCGFDLLRANGKSYVCDVNGFSFVKTSTRYYEDTARILGRTILDALSRMRVPRSLNTAPPEEIKDCPEAAYGETFETPSGKVMELRCVLAVIRHGDRTPKQKLKVIVHDERFFALFQKYEGFKKNEIKMKRPNQLMEVLELAREILGEHQVERNRLLGQLEACEEAGRGDSAAIEHDLECCEDDIKKWDQMRSVLEMYGHFSGINRKVQLKYLKARELRGSDTDEPRQEPPALLLILKWGGELTTAGTLQAEALGKLFRTLYPGIKRTDGKSWPEDTQGLGFLRLHSTYRHDLKIYASDEGRVQMTAAAFAKGLLALEGELTPILMQMVKSANTDGLLDDDMNARDFQNELKSYLHQALQVDREWTPADHEALNPNGLKSIKNSMEFIKNPRCMLNEIAGYVQRMCDIIQKNKLERPNKTLYLNEPWDLAERRWTKELREFRRGRMGDVEYDISKIPDIYDNIKYDMEHNPDLFNNEPEFERMYLCVKNMADIVVPQEYGIESASKMQVAQSVCCPLLRKMRNDLRRCVESNETDESQTRLDPRASQGIATPLRHVRTRLYFTSESHIHTLMNLIRYGGLCTVDDKKWQRAMNFLSGVTEFNYMTQVVLMVYEDSRPESAPGKERFHVELLFSPGLYPCFLTEKERIYENRLNSSRTSGGKTSSMSKTHSRDGNASPGSESSMNAKEKAPLDVELLFAEGGAAKDADSASNTSQRVPSANSNSSADARAQSRKSSITGGVEKMRTSTKDSISSSASSINDRVAAVATDELSVSSNADEIHVNSVGLVHTRTEHESRAQGDSEDDLNDGDSVNLVALDEVSPTKHAADEKGEKRQRLMNSNSLNTEKASEEGDKPKSKFASSKLAEWQHEVAGGGSTSLGVSFTTGTPPDSARDSVEPSSSCSKLADEVEKSLSGTTTPHDLTVGNDSPRLRPSSSPSKNNNSASPARVRSVSVGDDSADGCQATVDSGRGKWAKQLLDDTKKAMATGSVASAIDEDEETTRKEEQKEARRSRFPYRFKHHTVNFFTGSAAVQDRLISTDVLTGRFLDSNADKNGNGKKISTPLPAAVLSTAVIARSCSAPRLQTYKGDDAINVGEIKRFWPPLRSLETLHDYIGFKQFDEFLERLIDSRTPLPSPPKTPLYPAPNRDVASELHKEVEKLLTSS